MRKSLMSWPFAGRSPRWLVALAACVAFLGTTAAAAPEPVDLGGAWRFRLDPDDVGIAQRWQEATASTEGWTELEVPGMWEEKGHFGYDGIAWYAREVTVPAEWTGEKWALVFDGVDDEATIYIDGVERATNLIWNKRFWLLAEQMPGVAAGSTFTLVVRVNDKGIGGGIYQPVALRPFADLDELRITAMYRTTIPHNQPHHDDQVIYCIFVRNFTPEGTLRAAAARMAHIRNLGATMVWVMPIQPVGAERRKGTLGSPYAIADYTAVDPGLGTLDDARALVAAAHEHGLKIILDLVANHTAWDAAWMAAHPDWYSHGPDGAIIPPDPGWWDVADLDYDNADLRAAMEEVMRFWLEEVGFDGFRCDVAGMVPGDFWKAATGRLRAAHPDLYMLAEADGDTSLFLDGFNANYDNGLHATMFQVMWNGAPADSLLQHLDDRRFSSPRNAQTLRFTENHDQRRAAEAFGPPAARVLDALVFTVPGTPLIYNGREIDAFRRVELFDRETIDWTTDDDEPAGAWIARLAELRHRHQNLRRGEVVRLAHDGGPRVLVYGRAAERGIPHRDAARYVVALNLSSEPAENIHVGAWPDGYADPDATTMELRDLLTGRTAYRGAAGEARLSLDGHEALVLRVVE